MTNGAGSFWPPALVRALWVLAGPDVQARNSDPLDFDTFQTANAFLRSASVRSHEARWLANSTKA